MSFSMRFKICNWIFKGELRSRFFIMKYSFDQHCSFLYDRNGYLVNDIVRSADSIKFITRRFPIKFKICDFIYGGTLSYSLSFINRRLNEVYEIYKSFGFDDDCRRRLAAIIELINQLQYD